VSFLNKVTHRSKTNIRVLYVSMIMSLKTSYEPYTNTSSRTRKLGRPGKTIFQSLEFEHLKLEFKLSNSLRLESWIHASIVNTVTRQMELFSLKVAELGKIKDLMTSRFKRSWLDFLLLSKSESLT
jgi:hypothetical protein